MSTPRRANRKRRISARDSHASGTWDPGAILSRATQLLEKRGMQVTPLRRSVLELLYAEKKAIGAYDLTAASERQLGRRLRPNTVYRTLDFLEEQGLVVHLASTRAYAARAIREVVIWARESSQVSALTAETGIANIASQQVLSRNGFLRVGERVDDEDGPLICWRCPTD